MKRNKLILISSMAASALLLGACEVEKTEEGKMPDVDIDYQEGELPEYEIRKTEDGRLPDVDVDVQGGKLPKYDVKGPDVDVGTKEVTVEVPDVDVDVDTEEKVITVPDIDVDMPEDEDDDPESDRDR